MWWQQVQWVFPDVPLPYNLFQLLWRYSERFPSQMRYLISPACSGFTLGSPICWTPVKHHHWKAPEMHPDQTPEPHQLAPLDSKELQLYFKLPLDVQTVHLISKAEPSHPAFYLSHKALWIPLLLKHTNKSDKFLKPKSLYSNCFFCAKIF